jgi:uncharacterized phage-like protein YoqJ
MILGITGHRPDKLGGYKLPNPVYNKVCQKIEQVFKELQPEKIISGMALGVDQWAAFIACKLGIPFLAAVPFEGQEIKWPKSSQEIYHKLLKKASEVVVVSPHGYSARKLQIRNEWMVDYSDKMLAIWNGTGGGTDNCINYAKSLEKEIIYIDPGLTVR